MKNSVRDVDHGAGGRFSELEKFARLRVEVGILEDAPKETRGESSSLSLVEVATVHEFGAPEAGIPQRSFLRAWVDENGSAIRAQCSALAARIFKGELTADQAARELGDWAVEQVQGRIDAGIAPANAPSTVARKGSSTPLVDTKQLRNAITARVVGVA